MDEQKEDEMTEREQEMRMRCLDMANKQQYNVRPDDVIAAAQKMYDFAVGTTMTYTLGGAGGTGGGGVTGARQGGLGSQS